MLTDDPRYQVELDEEERRRLERYHRQVGLTRRCHAVASGELYRAGHHVRIDGVRGTVDVESKQLREADLHDLAMNLRPFWMNDEIINFQTIRGIVWKKTTTPGGQRYLKEYSARWKDLLNGMPPIVPGTMDVPSKEVPLVAIGPYKDGAGFPPGFQPAVATNKNVLELLLYGRVAHANKDELVALYDFYDALPIGRETMWFLFHDVLRRLLDLVLALDGFIHVILEKGRESVAMLLVDESGQMLELDLTRDVQTPVDVLPQWARSVES